MREKCHKCNKEFTSGVETDRVGHSYLQLLGAIF